MDTTGKTLINKAKEIREELELKERVSVESISLLVEINDFLEDVTIESDEDSCVGMGFIEGRVSEDWFYSLKNKIEKQIKTNGRSRSASDG